MDKKKKPVLIAGIGFLVCVLSFIIAAIGGKSSFSTYLFYTGFIIGSLGVLVGFLTFKKDE